MIRGHLRQKIKDGIKSLILLYRASIIEVEAEISQNLRTVKVRYRNSFAVEKVPIPPNPIEKSRIENIQGLLTHSVLRKFTQNPK